MGAQGRKSLELRKLAGSGHTATALSWLATLGMFPHLLPALGDALPQNARCWHDGCTGRLLRTAWCRAVCVRR